MIKNFFFFFFHLRQNLFTRQRSKCSPSFNYSYKLLVRSFRLHLPPLTSLSRIVYSHTYINMYREKVQREMKENRLVCALQISKTRVWGVGGFKRKAKAVLPYLLIICILLASSVFPSPKNILVWLLFSCFVLFFSFLKLRR